MHHSGKLAELPLEEILQTVQKERATGTLQVKADGGQATLYFLFGHLFHAVNGEATGESVVHDALGWNEGDFTFDAKAKLPAEETIKVSTAELLASRNGKAPVDADEAPEAPEAAEDLDEEGVLETAEATVFSADPEPEAEPGAEESTLNADGTPKRRRTDQRPGTRPPESMQLHPVPLGKMMYEALTASFVDFPKLLRSLMKDAHTGYVRLSADNFTGVLLFSSGSVVEALYDGGSAVATGKAAFDQFGAHIDDGDGVIDVIHLSPEMVTAIYQLLTAPSMYEKLLARFVKVDALLEHLQETGASGAVIVRCDERNGIVLFRDGVMLGSYTDNSREVSADPKKVLALCEKPHAEIEVRGGPVPSTLPVMEPGSGPKSVPSGAAKEKEAASPKVEPAAKSRTAVAEPVASEEVEEAPAEAAVDSGPVSGVDWDAVLAEMAGRADAVLGTRSKKVKEMLLSTNHNREDVDATLDRIADLSIMFVDPSKLTALADEMRQIAADAA